MLVENIEKRMCIFIMTQPCGFLSSKNDTIKKSICNRELRKIERLKNLSLNNFYLSYHGLRK